MGIGSYSQGWDGLDDYDDGGNGGGGNSGGGMSDNERLYKYRFSVPEPSGGKKPNLVPGKPAVKRVLFLSGLPFRIFEHGLFQIRDAYNVLGSFTAICLGKNGLLTGELEGQQCPMCAKNGGDNYPYHIGFFPVIDMGQVEFKNGKMNLHHETFETSSGKVYERAFQRVLLGAKRGSRDKPGILQLLFGKQEELKAEHGIPDLTGTVWHTRRSGQKEAAVGGDWEYRERVLPEDFEQYLVGHGADPTKLQLNIPDFTNASGTGIFDINPVVYYHKLSQLVGWESGSPRSSENGGAARGKSRVAGAGWGDDAPPPTDRDAPTMTDDDIPF